MPLLKFRLFLATMLCLAAAFAQAAVQQAFPDGPPQADVIRFQLAVYYLRPPRTDPAGAAQQLARAIPGLEVVPQLSDKPAGMQINTRMENNPLANYAPPGPDRLAYFGRGLSAAQAAALQKTPAALVLTFAHPKKHAFAALRNAYVLAGQMAQRDGALVWDEETREVFSVEKWHERRTAGWTETYPDVGKHTVIHSYKNGELVRAISLGMAKFGLPDLVVDQFPWSSNDSMGKLINATAQALVEGAVVGPGGRMNLDVQAIRNTQVRARETVSLKPNAKGVASLALLVGVPDDGDPPNRLAEIGFGVQPGADLGTRQDALLRTLYGTSDSVKYIRHDAELEAASALAKQKLQALQAGFARGLKPGEYIEVKAPFQRPKGGSEWMWVEVRSWKGKLIEGTLNNDPFDIPNLHSGQAVKVNQDDVFDYIHTLADGTQEGNTTGAIIEKMQGTVKK